MPLAVNMLDHLFALLIAVYFGHSAVARIVLGFHQSFISISAFASDWVLYSHKTVRHEIKDFFSPEASSQFPISAAVNSMVCSRS
jgi:hypothetical protein